MDKLDTGNSISDFQSLGVDDVVKKCCEGVRGIKCRLYLTLGAERAVFLRTVASSYSV